MYNKNKILAIVPARGGSKGIKNKNLKKIKKKSLIQITANLLKKIKSIDCSMISTDSDKIANEAVKFGLKFFRKRSKKLSGDKVSDAPVLKDALYTAEKNMNSKFNIVLMLQVTSPLRTKEIIIKAIKLLTNKKLNAVWSISEVDKKFHWLKQLKIKKKYLNYSNPGGNKIIARQQLKKSFIRNGAIYAFSRKTILNMNLLPKKTGYIILKSKQISIDNMQDLKIAGEIIN